MPRYEMSTLEICAGAGGQSLGLELAGFRHVAAIDLDKDACRTLRENRPEWQVLEADICDIDGHAYSGVDLLAGGMPCPPFSIAGKQLGDLDERDLFPQALRLTREICPRAILFENVRGLAAPRFASYRQEIASVLDSLGYKVFWTVLNAVDFGVPQYRTRFVIVGLRHDDARYFGWPAHGLPGATVGESIGDLMGARGWLGLEAWRDRANAVAPTIVGGSKKHGGPDLGPTRARAEWRKLGVDGKGIADLSPGPDFPVDDFPKLTVRMVARLQGFPDSWHISGRKTAAYKQIGNAFPPPLAMAVALSVQSALAGQIIDVERQLSLAAATLDVR